MNTLTTAPLFNPAYSEEMRGYLIEKAALYNRPGFIPFDPISIPHRFTALPDIEIMGFFAATLAWGLRKTIISNCLNLIELFEGEPYHFIVNHSESDLKRFLKFSHRTFNNTDLLYFIAFFKSWYSHNQSLESAFSHHLALDAINVEPALAGFHNTFFSLPFFPERTKKHVATPERNSACKRLNMFLRWMVRRDDNGVDFGLWKNISPAQLICPLDVHSGRVARTLGLLSRTSDDRRAALELTANLCLLNPSDPVLFDFALFGLGVEGLL